MFRNAAAHIMTSRRAAAQPRERKRANSADNSMSAAIGALAAGVRASIRHARPHPPEEEHLRRNACDRRVRELDADRWAGQVRQSDLENSFVCTACGRRRPTFGRLAATEPAAVGSVFWPCGVIQPVPGLFVGPTGNSVAFWDRNTLARA